METSNLNKSMCEELFGGKLDVARDSEVEKSQARLYKDNLRKKVAK